MRLECRLVNSIKHFVSVEPYSSCKSSHMHRLLSEQQSALLFSISVPWTAPWSAAKGNADFHLPHADSFAKHRWQH